MTVAIAIAAVALVVCAVVVVDAIAGARAEDAVEAQVEPEVGVDVRARIGGPFGGLRAITGRIPVLELTAAAVPVPDQDLVITDLLVEVRDLVVEGDAPVAGEGTFRAALDVTQVRAAAPPELADLIDLSDDALVVDLGLAAVPLDVVVVPLAGGDASLRLEPPGDIALLDEVVGGVTEVPLEVPDGVVVAAAAVVGARLVLTGTLDPVVVAAG